jgi:hypothetical protein
MLKFSSAAPADIPAVEPVHETFSQIQQAAPLAAFGRRCFRGQRIDILLSLSVAPTGS